MDESTGGSDGRDNMEIGDFGGVASSLLDVFDDVPEGKVVALLTLVLFHHHLLM